MADIARERVSFLGRFTVLKGAIPELWFTFAIKLLAVAAYQVMNVTLVLWLSSTLGFDDRWAGYMVFFWSASMTVFTILVGSLTDAIGLRRTFLLGVLVCILARAVMTFATVKWLALAGGLIPLAVGEALGTPVLVAAIRRYSTTKQRSISFSMFYVMMNVGFFVAYFLFDLVRAHMGERGHLTLPLIGASITTYQVLFLISFLIELLLLPVIYWGIREGAEATDEGVRLDADRPTPLSPTCAGCGYNLTGDVSGTCPECGSPVGGGVAPGIWGAIVTTVRRTLYDTGRNFAKMARQDGFYKLLAFLMLIAFVKLIFMWMYYAYPKFGIRELGEGAPVGRLPAINSVLIILLVPIVGALSQKSAAYRMVILGGAISAAAGFIMALPTGWFQTIADSALVRWSAHWYLGLSGDVNPWYVMIFLYVVVLSIGEAVYSPRVYEYAAAIAPKGQEASYSALSYVPFFLAKLFIGVFSGAMLESYCPETGARDSQTMWLIIALITTICPLGLITLRRWIRVPEAGREE